MSTQNCSAQSPKVSALEEALDDLYKSIDTLHGSLINLSKHLEPVCKLPMPDQAKQVTEAASCPPSTSAPVVQTIRQARWRLNQLIDKVAVLESSLDI